MKAPAFQFYAGDFLVGTAAMTAEAVGGYIRVLCYQWANGPLVNDPAVLARITGCTSNACAEIMQKLCIDDAGRLYNERLEQSRKDREEFAASRAENAKKGWEKRKNHTPSNACASAVQCTSNALQSSVFSLHNNTPPTPKGAGELVETDEPKASDIYEAYPRHVAKKEAIKAIERVMRAGLSSAYLLERTEAYARTVKDCPEDRRQFIPHPATWFNRGSYGDDPSEWARVLGPSQATPEPRTQHITFIN